MFYSFDDNVHPKLQRSDIHMSICRSSGACEFWMIECYKHSASLALKTEDVDSNHL